MTDLRRLRALPEPGDRGADGRSWSAKLHIERRQCPLDKPQHTVALGKCGWTEMPMFPILPELVRSLLLG
jgi:hypothetical protein